ncbi:MAG TPA: tetratricopeptide repeat protein [Usitatibacter sp.]|nr:tetratricopeptide repeat protein [Usitatibacter sp.]
MDDLEGELRRGRDLRQAGRLPEALAVFDALLARAPRAAAPRALRGLTLCNLDRFEEGIAELREAIALEPRNPAYHCDLGLVLFALDEVRESESELRHALMLAPGDPDSLTNLALVLRARGDFAGAESAARQALARRPELYAARINLGYALLAQGRFAEAWPHHDYRPESRMNLRDPHNAGIVPHVDRLPPAPSPIVLHGEQGLGDALFFLRFAPALRSRGHRLAFWGDRRLQPILARTGIFEHFIAPEAAPAEELAVVWIGDLPGMLGADDPTAFPPPLPIQGDPARRAALEDHLGRFGPPPYVGLTWRAGSERRGRIALAKALPAERLASALRGLRATFLSMQRAPVPGEIVHASRVLGAPIHDAASLNERLEDALAAMEILDEYVAVSNTNVHLRACAGRGARVLVPWPPEWRWLRDARHSPWFPAMEIYRQSPDGNWDAALQRLSADLHVSRRPS